MTKVMPALLLAMLALPAPVRPGVAQRGTPAEFTAKKPPFLDRDLYVVCIGPDHIIRAPGGGVPGPVAVPVAG